MKEKKMNIKQSKLIQYSIISLIIFIIGVILVSFTILFRNIDNYILFNLPFLWKDLLTKIMIVITSVVSTEVIIIMSLIFFVWFLYKHEKAKAIIIFLVPSITATIIWLLKKIIQRARPIGYQLIIETRNSLPSGHTTMAVVFFGALFYLFYDKIKYKKTAIISSIIIVLLVGVSRIYLGVHWFSDIIISVFLGLSLLFGYIYLIRKYKLFNKNRKIILKK